MSAIAFIGLGQMGAPMAKNLLKQGHRLQVFDVNPQAVQTLVESGAQAVDWTTQAPCRACRASNSGCPVPALSVGCLLLI